MVPFKTGLPQSLQQSREIYVDFLKLLSYCFGSGLSSCFCCSLSGSFGGIFSRNSVFAEVFCDDLIVCLLYTSDAADDPHRV